MEKILWIIHSNHVIFWPNFEKFIIVTWPICVHKWKLGKGVELLAGEANKYIKIGVMSQRVYNDLTEGHRSPGWVSISFFGFL